MTTDFQIFALEANEFEDLLSMDHQQLKEQGAYWIEVDDKPKFPCRISLEDAEIGEMVLALSYTHHNKLSPYNSSGPIFIRKNVASTLLNINQTPKMLHHRKLSVRAYSAKAEIAGGALIDGNQLSQTLKDLFSKSEIDYIQIHHAINGCFFCTAKRAG